VLLGPRGTDRMENPVKGEISTEVKKIELPVSCFLIPPQSLPTILPVYLCFLSVQPVLGKSFGMARFMKRTRHFLSAFP